MTENINGSRRRLLGATIAGIGAMQLGFSGLVRAQSAGTTSATSFADIRQINAGTLSIGYAQVGPENGPPVILLHGWPYDIHSFAEVAPMLAAQGIA